MIVQNVIPQEMRLYVSRVANFKIQAVKLMPVNSTSFVAGDNISFNLPTNTIIDTRSFSPCFTIQALAGPAWHGPAEHFIKSLTVSFSNGRQETINDYSIVWECVRDWTMSSDHLESRSVYSGDYVKHFTYLAGLTSAPLAVSTDTAQSQAELTSGAELIGLATATGNVSLQVRHIPQYLLQNAYKVVNVSSWLGILDSIGYIDMNFAPSLTVSWIANDNNCLGGSSVTYAGSALFATINILTMPQYSDSVLELLSSGESMLNYVFTRWNITTAGVGAGTQQNINFQVASSCLKRIWVTFRRGTADAQGALLYAQYLKKYHFSSSEATSGAISQVQLSLNNQFVDAYPRLLANIPFETARALGKLNYNDSDSLVENYYQALNAKFACVYNFSIPNGDQSEMSGYDTLDTSVNGIVVIDQTAAMNPLTGFFHVIAESAGVISIGSGRDLNISY